MNKDVIIIGAGMAGLTAAIYASRAGKSVLVLEKAAIGGQIITSLNVKNWPGFSDISGTELMNKIREQASDFGAEIRYEEVVSIKDDSGKFLIETDSDNYSCDAVIIAVGLKPRELSEKQRKDAGKRPISYCATCDGALYKNKPVVVIGSGNTAKYEMKYLEGICSKVYHIHHDDPIPEEAEAVFVAIGRVPETAGFKDLVEMDDNGYIVAGEDCKTSRAGVFVAGDVRTKSVRQLVTAAADGAVAVEQVVDYLSKK